MKKYAIIILCVLCGLCGYLAYRLGRSDCRMAVAEERVEIQQMVAEHDDGIRQKVIGTDSDVNRQWLCDNWARGN